MFTLLKLGVSIVALLAFAWFGMTVKLGSRTLFEHLHAIEQTKESQELVDGTREAVRQRRRRKGSGRAGSFRRRCRATPAPRWSACRPPSVASLSTCWIKRPE